MQPLLRLGWHQVVVHYCGVQTADTVHMCTVYTVVGVSEATLDGKKIQTGVKKIRMENWKIGKWTFPHGHSD